MQRVGGLGQIRRVKHLPACLHRALNLLNRVTERRLNLEAGRKRGEGGLTCRDWSLIVLGGREPASVNIWGQRRVRAHDRTEHELKEQRLGERLAVLCGLDDEVTRPVGRAVVHGRCELGREDREHAREGGHAHRLPCEKSSSLHAQERPLRDVAHEHGGETNRRRARSIGMDLESEGGVDERVRVGVAAHHFEGVEHRALGGYRKGGAQHHQVWLESVPLVQKVEHVHRRPNACDCRDHCQRDARDAENERNIGWEVRVALGEDQVASP